MKPLQNNTLGMSEVDRLRQAGQSLDLAADALADVAATLTGHSEGPVHQHATQLTGRAEQLAADVARFRQAPHLVAVPQAPALSLAEGATS